MTSIIRHYEVPLQSHIGDTKISAFMWDHQGWLKCDGRLVDKEVHNRLFNIIGTSFGISGDTHFALPNPAGRVPGIIGSGPGLTPRMLGGICGEEMHTLSLAEMPIHTHDKTVEGTVVAGLIYKSKTGDPSNTNNGTDLDGTIGEPNIVTSPTTMDSAGSGLAHNVMQPTLFVGNMFIYAGI
jgi:microcystin-dependent protein